MSWRDSGQVLPERASDPRQRTESYIARRSGAADPAAEARAQRQTQREPVPYQSAPFTTITNASTWNPGTLLTGDKVANLVTIDGVRNDGTSVAVASLTSMGDFPTALQLTAGITSNGTVAVILTNVSAATHIVSAGTLFIVVFEFV